MRKLVLLTILFVSLGAQCQITKGRLYISGSSDLSLLSLKKEETGRFEKSSEETSFSFAPSAAYVVFDNTLLGVRLNYSSLKETEGEREEMDKSLGIGPFVRYYVGEWKFKPFVEGEIQVGNSKYSNKDGTDLDTELEYKLFGYAVSGGVAAFVNDYLSFDMSIGYQGQNREGKELDHAIDSKGLAVRLGVSIVL